MNITPVHVVLFLHILFFITGFGSVIVIDTFGLLWLLKKAKLGLVTQVANVTQTLIWLGWAGLIVTGAVMLVGKGGIDNLMWVKLFAVFMLGLNGIYLAVAKHGFEQLPDQGPVPALFKFRIAFATTISQAGWWTALIIGFLHHNVSHEITSPAYPWRILGAVLALALAVLLTGELYFRMNGQNYDKIDTT